MSQTIQTMYDYKEANGILKYQVVRFEGKVFRPRRMHPTDGTWIWGLSAGRYAKFADRNGDWFAVNDDFQGETQEFGECGKILYRLPEIIAADPKNRIIVVEGERDADKLVLHGFVATCNPFGAGVGKWLPTYSDWFTAKHACVIADNDPIDPNTNESQGKEHAKAIVNSLLTKAATVKYIDAMPGVGDKGDVSDWFASGKTKQDFIELLKTTPVVTERLPLARDSKVGMGQPAQQASQQAPQQAAQQAAQQPAKQLSPAKQEALVNDMTVRALVEEARKFPAEKKLVLIQHLCSELAVHVADQ